MASTNSEKLAQIRAQASINRANANANKTGGTGVVSGSSANKVSTPKPSSLTSTQKPIINATTTSGYTGGHTINGTSYDNVSSTSPSNLSKDYGSVAYLGNQTNQNYQFSGAGVGMGADMKDWNAGLLNNAYTNSANMGIGSDGIQDFEYMARNGIRPTNMTTEQERNFNEYRNNAQREAFDLYHAGGDLSQLSNYQQGIVKGYEQQIEMNKLAENDFTVNGKYEKPVLYDMLNGNSQASTPQATTPQIPPSAYEEYLQQQGVGNTVPTAETPNLGHVYAPGQSSNSQGYTQKQLVTNELFNRYLQQIYQGGF